MVFGREDSEQDTVKKELMTYDPERLENVCNGNDTLRKRILTEYALTTPPLVAQLLNNLDAGNTDEASRLAHTLKGSSRTIGGVAFGDLCSRVELHAHGLGTKDLKKQIETEFEKLREAIDVQLGSG